MIAVFSASDAKQAVVDGPLVLDQKSQGQILISPSDWDGTSSSIAMDRQALRSLVPKP